MPALLAVLDFLFLNTTRAVLVATGLAVAVLTGFSYGVVFGPLALIPMVPVGLGLGWKLADCLCRALCGNRSLWTFLTTNPLAHPEIANAPVQRDADQ